MSKKILLIGDVVGYGKLALSAMIPILSRMGCEVLTLPTSLVSNAFQYGKYAIVDTSQYMRESISTWKELGFQFDAIATGFITSDEQAALVSAFCQEQRALGTRIYTDPIMGDDGALYCGLSGQYVRFFKELTALCDVMVPNYTEACLLTDTPYSVTSGTRTSAEELLAKLRKSGARSVIVTSAFVDELPHVVGYDEKHDETFFLPFRRIPVSVPGTGDIFAAVLIGCDLAGIPLRESTQAAMTAVYRLIQENLTNDLFYGIPIETCLSTLMDCLPAPLQKL